MGLSDGLDSSLFFGEIRKVFRLAVFEGDQLPGAQMGSTGFGGLLLSDNGSRQNERSRDKCDWSSFHGVCVLNFVGLVSIVSPACRSAQMHSTEPPPQRHATFRWSR